MKIKVEVSVRGSLLAVFSYERMLQRLSYPQPLQGVEMQHTR